jgi:predicted ATP-dependent endonuclease of OLD family
LKKNILLIETWINRLYNRCYILGDTMELINVEINNYRSIENVKLDFDNDTKVFLGISETGKSNMLKALSVIDQNYKCVNEDVRFNISFDIKANVRYRVKFSNEEKAAIVEVLRVKSRYLNDIDKIFINKSGSFVKIYDLISDNSMITVDLRNGKRTIDDFFVNDNLDIDSKINKIISPSVLYHSNNVYSSSVELGTIFSSDSYRPNTETTNAEVKDVIDFFYKILNNDYVSSITANVLYWKYDSKYVLPSEILAAEFTNKPDICIPLKNMFELAGVSDISNEYNNCKNSGNPFAWKNLLDKISNKVNRFIKEKWKAIPGNTKIKLEESGNNILISVKDAKNNFGMSSRSDGYKRFITFLLIISMQNKTNKLNNCLILIDSPDLEIDVPSQRFLKKELIELGKKNYVFYSTHSPYMIDNSNIERNYIVSKKNEITSIKIADDSNDYDDAIILNSLGTTLFDNVNDINVAFEGYTDEKLFDVGKTFIKADNKRKIDKLGRCQFGGLKNINSFASIWELVCRTKKCIICIDNDEKAVEKKGNYLNKNLDEICEITSYSNFVDSSRKIETAEDFLTADYIKSKCDEFSRKHNNLNLIDFDKLKDDSRSKMDTINAWLGKFGFEKGEQNQKRGEIKRSMFNELKPENIREDYATFLDAFIRKYLN